MTAAPTEKPSGIECPFCHEDGFDLIGLKMHIISAWCGTFNAIDIHRELKARPQQPQEDGR